MKENELELQWTSWKVDVVLVVLGNLGADFTYLLSSFSFCQNFWNLRWLADGKPFVWPRPPQPTNKTPPAHAGDVREWTLDNYLLLDVANNMCACESKTSKGVCACVCVLTPSSSLIHFFLSTLHE